MRNLDENKTLIILDARREEYGKVEASESTMTLRELINTLEEYAEDYGDDAKIIPSHDRGYTYGGIRKRLFDVWTPEDDEEEDE